jgi:hypothetical protein
MTIRAMFFGLVALTLLNAGIFAMNWVSEVRAEAAGMGDIQLRQDPDFAKAVRTIVENCRVSDRRIRC